ncbi:hypothetical protein BDZ94DRAFT_1302053 [Collybia nuda]|uniref:DUF6534 domain-containing protein n=1 Tax=Collybia nuda TaxID=64659 RepID=A0A9P6CCJ9_9AGAR|nr:hypothetical protein BDZ94DRAFT_1302053 [Collybia nuda]
MEVSAFNLLSSDNLGALVMGLSISLVLCGIAILQSYLFYQCSDNDPLFLKIWALAILVLELTHSSLIISVVYFYVVFLKGNTPHGPNSYLIATSVIPEVLVTALVQAYFALRIYRLSQTMYVSVLCWSLSLLRLGGGLVLVVEGFIDVSRVPNTITLTTEFGWLITLVFAVGASVDVLTAACLCYYLKRLTPSEPLKSTSDLVNRIILRVIQTGTVTSFVFWCIKVFDTLQFHIKPHAVYSNSFFALLNMRRGFQTGRFLEVSVSGVQFHENVARLELDGPRIACSQESSDKVLGPEMPRIRSQKLDGLPDVRTLSPSTVPGIHSDRYAGACTL